MTCHTTLWVLRVYPISSCIGSWKGHGYGIIIKAGIGSGNLKQCFRMKKKLHLQLQSKNPFLSYFKKVIENLEYYQNSSFGRIFLKLALVVYLQCISPMWWSIDSHTCFQGTNHSAIIVSKSLTYETSGSEIIDSLFSKKHYCNIPGAQF